MKHPAITEHHLYLKTFRKGKRFSGRILSVYVLKDHMAQKLCREDPLHRVRNRLGLSVTKKVGGAVVRSRVKRILRAGFDRVKVKNKRFIKGVRLKPDDAEGEDFLS